LIIYVLYNKAFHFTGSQQISESAALLDMISKQQARKFRRTIFNRPYYTVRSAMAS